jgi:predicted dehydrogenase
LVGIAETIPELVTEARKVAGDSVPIYSDYKKMLDEQKSGIVWAFVENNRHREIVEACAPRKIHVIFEKPLAATYKDALAIRDLAAKYGIKVMCNYQMAWWPANFAAKKEVDAGSVGQVLALARHYGHGGPGATVKGPGRRPDRDLLRQRQMARLNEASAVPEPYPYWHQQTWAGVRNQRVPAKRA